VQDYIYGIISTENDHRHHHKFIKYEKQLRKEGKNCLEPINNTWFLGKSESVNACKKADFDGFREKDE
jgi:hypothetical protein